MRIVPSAEAAAITQASSAAKGLVSRRASSDAGSPLIINLAERRNGR
jgi:hypothetical protein